MPPRVRVALVGSVIAFVAMSIRMFGRGHVGGAGGSDDIQLLGPRLVASELVAAPEQPFGRLQQRLDIRPVAAVMLRPEAAVAVLVQQQAFRLVVVAALDTVRLRAQ
jgi:hypothetical protein